jgi:hypothetical protein
MSDCRQCYPHGKTKREGEMYFLCQKCSTVEHATPQEIEKHTTWYHMHNNAWWPLQFVTTSDAMAAMEYGSVIMSDGTEPKYTQAEVDARRSTKEAASGRPRLGPLEEPKPGVPEVDWDYELRILLLEGK